MANQWRPGATVEILAGTPEGGGQDRVARAMAAALPFECRVTNLPGRGGANAWESLLETPGDPHRVAVSSPTLVTNALLGEAASDDRDLTPIATLCTEAIVFAVSDASDVESPVALLKRLGEGSATTALATAAGNVNHMAVGMVARYAGADPASTPIRVFDAAPQAVADLVAGSSELAAVSAASLMGDVADGRVRPLAVTSAERLAPPFEGVPTWTELHVPCLIGTWRGVVAAPGLTTDECAGWDALLAEMAASAAWQVPLTDHRWQADYRDRAGTKAFLDDQRDAMARMLGDLGLLG